MPASDSAARVAPAVIVAAPASGTGKTVFTLGLLRHLHNAGINVAGAKVGPDYIDPVFHTAACRRQCPNLDSWAMREDTLIRLAYRQAYGSELVVVEGVMGLFDGATVDGGRNDGSTAALAELTGWPVVLVVDAGRQAASAAVLVKGFRAHRKGCRIKGVVFNKVGSDRHAALLKEAVAAICPEVEVLGCLPRLDGLELPSRHLGLVQAYEHPDLDRFLDLAAEWIEGHVDVKKLRELADPWPARPAEDPGPPLGPLGQRIAVARDDAFAFAYTATLDGWRDAGAEIQFFSPLRDDPPWREADAVFLPGGYPELHAGKIAGNWDFMDGLKAAKERGAAVYGECGGYMVLGKALIDAQGRRHPMADLLPVETSFAEKRMHLGYREATLAKGGPLGGARQSFRGHEFHFASVVEEGPGIPLFRIKDAKGRDLGTAGLADQKVMGSFIHLIDRRT